MLDEPAGAAVDVRMRPMVLACVAIGGAFGSLVRYGVGRAVPVPVDGFPRATFLVNVTGAFVLGCFLTIVHERRWVARYARPLFAIGFLGAFTTFSTLAVETVVLVKDGHAGLGIFYLSASVTVGIAACVLGVVIGRGAAQVGR